LRNNENLKIKEQLNLAEFSQIFRPKISENLVKLLAKKEIPQGLKDGMLYSLVAGGKRIRPLLTLMVIASFGEEIDERALNLACSVEFVHTYSLIHDDLPAMDNDDYRRGKLTNHKVYGEAAAILAGDALLTFAFQIIAELTSKSSLKVELLSSLAQATGASGMVAGQILDLAGSTQDTSLADLRKIHNLKTGALLQYSVYAGFLIIREQNFEIFSDEFFIKEALLKFAQNFGLAFQIRDDILDITKTTAELGKTAGKDLVQRKSTYPRILGLRESKKCLLERIAEAIKIINDLEDMLDNFSGKLLKELARSLEVD